MRIPKSLEALADQGIIQEVVRPLMSGKEAQIYLVVSEDTYCAAKIYKDAQHRSFKNRADYVEGRKVRSSRDQRAIDRGTKYGKSKSEEDWKSTEVEMVYRLHDAGVRVPTPFLFIDGVFLMELVVDEQENPAPRLGDVEFTPREATEVYSCLLREVTLMLCAGVVHGDLSEFNVLLAHDGPVVIDFPQAVNAAGNLNARRLLLRDMDNLHRFLERWVPGARRRPYGEELWSLYESNRLTPETQLSGHFKRDTGPVDTRAVMALIGDANLDEAARRRAKGESTAGLELNQQGPAPRRREYVVEKPASSGNPRRGQPSAGHGARPARGGGPGGQQGGAGRDGARSSSPGRASQAERSGPPRRSGPPGGQHARSSAPGRRPETHSKPKRGDNVQASTYVSPEARKTKVKPLTPRHAPDGPGQRAGRQGPQENRGGRPTGNPEHRAGNAHSAGAKTGTPGPRHPPGSGGNRGPSPPGPRGANSTRAGETTSSGEQPSRRSRPRRRRPSD